MKVVVAVHHFPPHFVAGAEKEAYRMAKSLKERGHHVSVICVEDISSGPEQGLTWEDTEFDSLPVRRLYFRLKAAPDPKRWEYDNLWINEHLTAYLSELKPDVFFLVSGYLMTGSAITSAKSLGIFTAVYLTDFWFLCPRITMLRSNGQLSTLPIDAVSCAQCLGEEKRRFRWPGQLAPEIMHKYWQGQSDRITEIDERKQFLKDALESVDLLISPSQFLRSIYTQSGIPENRILFIRQGLDLIPTRKQQSRPAQKSTLQVGYMGQIANHKGVHLLVDAIRAIPQGDLNVSIYGDDQAFPAYTSYLRRRIGTDQRIHLSGVFRGREEMERIMANLDVLVVPSVWFENSPNVILEAFSFHIPVITSNLGGMAEMVQDGQNGFLFEPGNADDLAIKIKRLLDHKDLLQEFKANISPVKTVKQQMDEIETLVTSMISMKKPVELLS